MLRLWRDFKRALARPVTRRLLGALVLLWLIDHAVYFLTEMHWHHAVGFGAAWQVRIKAQLLLFGAAFGITLLLGLLLKPLWNLPANPPRLPPAYQWLEQRLRILMRFDERLSASLIFAAALWNGWTAALHWPQWLLFLHGGNWGYTTPLWPLDVSWWIFRVPFWQLLLNVIERALWLVLFCGLLLSLGRGAARFFNRRPVLPLQVLQGLALLGMALFLVRGAQFALMPLHEMSSNVLDATSWNGRRPAWWLSAVFNLCPAVLLLFFLSRRHLSERTFAFSVALAFCATPVLLWTFSRMAPLFGGDAAFIAMRHAATRHAWGLDAVATKHWQPLTAPRHAPQNSEWLKYLRFDEVNTPNIQEQSGASIGLNSSLWHFLWAWRQRDLSLLRWPGSFVPHRTLEAQRAALAPFLLPGNALRRVEVEGEVFYLQELLVATDHFPGANAELIGDEGQTKTINSARAAVLLVMPVPQGTMKFYALQAMPNALTRAWQNALPGLILPFDSLPPGLQNQRRYPVELLKRQAHQLSETTGADWHLARQWGSMGWPQTQEPIFAWLPSNENLDSKFSILAQAALCSDSNGQTLAALLRAGCEGETFGKLTLLHFDNKENANNSLAPLDSGLIGPNALTERMEAALTQISYSSNKEKTALQWTIGTVVPVAVQHQVWLWQPIFRLREKTKTLVGLAVSNAAWGDGPIGVGHNAHDAIKNWQRAAQSWDSSSDLQDTQSLKSRLHAFLEPNKARQEAQIARLIELAAKLHQAALNAEKTDRAAAQWLRQQEGTILKKLQILVPPTATEEP